jgi:hypothetical protein
VDGGGGVPKRVFGLAGCIIPRMARLNGWKRLWVVVSVVWTVLVALGTGEYVRESSGGIRRLYSPTGKWWDVTPEEEAKLHEAGIYLSTQPTVTPPSPSEKPVTPGTRRWYADSGVVLLMLAIWLVPPVTLYAIGWSIAWVRRGFAQPSAP